MTGPHVATRSAAAGDQGGTPGAAGQSWGTRAGGLLARHWLLAVLLAGGLALRIAAQIAYRPALIYVDTLKYLYGASPGADPLGYTGALGHPGLRRREPRRAGPAPARPGRGGGAVRGAAAPRHQRWLAAVAVAPVLLDAYQVQMEQMIMPDVWFEAMLVAGPGPAALAAGS